MGGVFLAKLLEIKIKNWETLNVILEREGLKDLVDIFLTRKPQAALDLGLHFNGSKHIDCIITFACYSSLIQLIFRIFIKHHFFG